MTKIWKERLAFLLLGLSLPWMMPLSGTAALPVQGEALVEREPGENAGPDLEDVPMVALTFDDGPRRSTTSDLLDGLAQRGVRATFFLIGGRIENNEDLVARMEAEGHQIGLHSFDHKILTALSAADFERQVGREREALEEIVGREDFPLRPPYGEVDAGVERRAGGPIILWSVDPEDWRYKDANQVAEHILAKVQDGDIILLHDIYPTSVEAALMVVDELHARGFLLVTVAELAQSCHVELEDGKVYRHFYR